MRASAPERRSFPSCSPISSWAPAADPPVAHPADDLRSAFDAARAHHRAVGELELVMKLEQLLPGVGIQRDHGPLAVLVADEHDTVADGERAEGLASADSALDAVERGPLPQDLSRAGIDGMHHAVDGREPPVIVEHADAIGAYIGGRIHQRPELDRAAD